MSDNLNELLSERQYLLIERIFCRLNNEESAADPQALPGLYEFFNSTRSLPSFEQIYI
jgi:hypothetical protein